QGGNRADIGRERRPAAEGREVAKGGHQACGGLRPNAVDRRQKPTDLVRLEEAVDIALEIAQPEVFAEVAHLQAIGFAMVARPTERAAAVSSAVASSSPTLWRPS